MSRIGRILCYLLTALWVVGVGLPFDFAGDSKAYGIEYVFMVLGRNWQMISLVTLICLLGTLDFICTKPRK